LKPGQLSTTSFQIDQETSMPNYIPDYVERRERAAWDNATFGAIFQTLSDVFPPEKVEKSEVT